MADPTQPNVVWLGGAMNYPEIFSGPFRSNGRAVMRSTDGGTTFTDMTNDTVLPPQGMHPDQHALVLNPGNHEQAIIGSDGGVVRTDGTYDDASGDCDTRGLTGDDLAFCQLVLSAVPREIVSMNAGLNTLQFQSLSVNADAPYTDVTAISQKRLKSGKVKFRITFAANTAKATFACKLSPSKKYGKCRSPWVHSLKPGTYTFRVRAHGGWRDGLHPGQGQARGPQEVHDHHQGAALITSMPERCCPDARHPGPRAAPDPRHAPSGHHRPGPQGATRQRAGARR